jgi:hypothetical protein
MLMLLQLQGPSYRGGGIALQASAAVGVPGVISCGVIMFTLFAIQGYTSFGTHLLYL